jgi:hypothetical protein
MATRKAAAAKAAPTVSPDPDDTQPAGGAGDSDPVIDTPIETVDAFVAEVQDAPPSSITVAVGSAGYYTGARPAETLAQYNTRLGAVADTFGDLGWILGTKPKV